MSAKIIIDSITPASKIETNGVKKESFFLTGLVTEPLHLGQQPNIGVMTEKPVANNKAGDEVDLTYNEINPLHMTSELDSKDPWEFLGSDGISGTLWYGSKQNIDNLTSLLKEKIINYYTTEKTVEFDEQAWVCTPMLSWDFADGSSLLLFYGDDEIKNIKSNELIVDGLINYHFGAKIDDRLAYEFLLLPLVKELKKIKVPNADLDEEFLEDVSDDSGSYFEYVCFENKPLHNKKYKTNEQTNMVLNLAYHMFCTLLQWNKADMLEQDENIFVLAKKLETWVLVNSLAPKSQTATSERFVFNEDNSEKEYTISLYQENNAWNLKASYGRVGKKLTENIKFSALSFNEAKNAYINLLTERLAKGYVLENHKVTTKLKM